MVKVFESAPTQISGDNVIGGTIQNFSSIGIKDNATTETLVVSDGKITVPSITVNTVDGNITVRGDIKVYGVLDAGYVRTTELITNQRYEKQYLEFASPHGVIGTGLLWSDPSGSKQFVVRSSPDRLWTTENIDLAPDKSYFIDGVPVVTKNSLGVNVTSSNLQKVGVLQNLSISGNLNIDEHIFYNSSSQRLGLGTDSPNGLLSILDYINNVEIIIDSDTSTGYGKIGTHSTKGLSLVTDDTPRISITEQGNITLGQEQKDSTLIRMYGKVGVGVKNPTEQFEVAGNVKFGNRLFAQGNTSPESGYYNIGDIIWNTAPRPGAYVGWVCTNNGNPGSWNGFGLIA